MRIIQAGSTSPSVDIFLADDSGLPVTGETASGFPTVYFSVGGANVKTAITLADLSTETTAWSSGGLKERSNGWYRLDLPTAVASTAGANLTVFGDTSGLHVYCPPIVIGPVVANKTQANGNAITTTTAGVEDINVKTIVGQAPTMTNVAGEQLMEINVRAWASSGVALFNGYPITDMIAAGAVVSGTATTITVALNTSAPNWVGLWLMIVYSGGAGNACMAIIKSVANGTSTVLTVDRAFAVIPNNTCTYYVRMGQGPALDSSLQVAANAVNGNVSGSIGSISGVTFPTNFSSISIDGSGRLVLQPTQPSTLVIPTVTTLTNAPAANSTETAIYNKLPVNNIADETVVTNQLGALSSQIGSPTQTGTTLNCNLIQINGSPAGGDPYPIVTSGSFGNAQLLAAIQNVQNNTFIASSIPGMLSLPASGSISIQIVFTFYDETGAAKNLDTGNPTALLVNDSGADQSSRLGSWSNPAVGKYVIACTNNSTDAVEGLHWDVSGTINSKLRRIVAYTQIVQTITSTFTAADRTLLTSIGNVSPAFPPGIDSSGRMILQPTQPGVTIPTVTTVTSPVSLTGDLTPTMKASVSAAVPTANTIATATAAAMLVDGTANPIKVNPDHSINADIDEAGLATNIAAAVAGEVDITVQNNIAIPPAVAVASQDPTVITCLRGDTLRCSLPSMGDISTRSKLVMTAKENLYDADDQAILQIIEHVGLVRLNGSDSVTAGSASLEVTNATTGDVILEIDAGVTAALAIVDLYWDVQTYLAGGITTPINGTVNVVADVTQAVT